MSESPTPAANRHFRVVATFSPEHFDPVEMIGGKWFGLITVGPDETNLNVKIDQLGLVPLTDEEAEAYASKKVEQQGSLAKRYALPPSAPETVQPAAVKPSPSLATGIDPEAVTTAKPTRKK